VTKDNIIIRGFEPKDIKNLSELTNELGYPTTVEEMETRMKIISKLDNHWTFVAVVEGEVAGYIGLNKHYFWEQNGHFIRVQALVVKKEFRRLNIGKALINHAEKLARQTGAKLIILNCGNKPERESAHQFYPKMGFEAKSIGYVKQLD
jgi:GNAT superfamily N-acetyltransferase